MLGTVLEFSEQRAGGSVRLEDGRTLRFDVSACRPGIPEAGAEVDVELGPSVLGGEKVVRLQVRPRWERVGEVPFLVLRGTESGGVEVIYLDGKRHRVRDLERPLFQQEPSPGGLGLLTIEENRSTLTASGRKDRVAAVRLEEPASKERLALRKAWLEEIKEEIDMWNDEDGCHCRYHWESLQANVAAALEHGLRVKSLPKIEPWPIT